MQLLKHCYVLRTVIRFVHNVHDNQSALQLIHINSSLQKKQLHRSTTGAKAT